MNCNSQDPEWVCCTDALLPSARIGLWGAPMRGGGPGSSLALCVCSGSDQIRCLGTGLFSLSGCWERPVCLRFGPVAPKRQWVQSLQFLWGRGGRTEGSSSRGVGAPGSLSPPSSWAPITGNTDVPQTASMRRHRREWVERCHLTGSVCTRFWLKIHFLNGLAQSSRTILDCCNFEQMVLKLSRVVLFIM